MPRRRSSSKESKYRNVPANRSEIIPLLSIKLSASVCVFTNHKQEQQQQQQQEEEQEQEQLRRD